MGRTGRHGEGAGRTAAEGNRGGQGRRGRCAGCALGGTASGAGDACACWVGLERFEGEIAWVWEGGCPMLLG